MTIANLGSAIRSFCGGYLLFSKRQQRRAREHACLATVDDVSQRTGQKCVVKTRGILSAES